MAEKETNKLENKLKWDVWELIPGIGLFKCLAINFDEAQDRGYKGFGGQFKRHCEQSRDLGLTSSIPTSMLSYAFLWQLPACGIILYFLAK